MTTAPPAVELPRHLRWRLLTPASRLDLDRRIRIRPFRATWFLTHPDDVQHVLVTGAEGFVGACGPGIGGRGAIADLSPVDFAPTLLTLLGVDSPADMPGRSRSEILGRSRT